MFPCSLRQLWQGEQLKHKLKGVIIVIVKKMVEMNKKIAELREENRKLTESRDTFTQLESAFGTLLHN